MRRYRKRGIHLQGHVANDVETEQIAFMGFDWRSGYPVVSSAVQVCQACSQAPC